jgi:hypothetical protein
MTNFKQLILQLTLRVVVNDNGVGFHLMEIEVKIEYGKAFHIRVGITSLEVNVVDGTTLSYGG